MVNDFWIITHRKCIRLQLCTHRRFPEIKKWWTAERTCSKGLLFSMPLAPTNTQLSLKASSFATVLPSSSKSFRASSFILQQGTMTSKATQGVLLAAVYKRFATSADAGSQSFKWILFYIMAVLMCYNSMRGSTNKKNISSICSLFEKFLSC